MPAPTKAQKAQYLREITDTQVHFEVLSASDLDVLYDLFTNGIGDLAQHVGTYKAQEVTGDIVSLVADQARARVNTIVNEVTASLLPLSQRTRKAAFK